MTENEQLAEAMTAAALRQQQAARPMLGRQEGMATRVPEAAVQNLMTLPKRAFGAAQQYADTGAYNPEPVVDAATTLMTGGMPMAAKGAAGIFGGRLSMTADHRAMFEAERMAQQRVPKEQIRQETGWLQQPDKQWRSEIPSAEQWWLPSIYKPEVRQGTVPLGSVYHDPALYAAYPELKDLAFGLDKSLRDTRISGYYARPVTQDLVDTLSPELQRQLMPQHFQHRVILNPGVPEGKRMPVLAHELQHYIQNKEGFAQGGRAPERIVPGTVPGKLFEQFYGVLDPENLKQMSPRRFATALGESKPPSKTGFAVIQEAMEDAQARKEIAERVTRNQAYRRLLGESEARLAEKRLGMTAAQQRERIPKLDVPDRQLIIRMRDDEPWD